MGCDKKGRGRKRREIKGDGRDCVILCTGDR